MFKVEHISKSYGTIPVLKDLTLEFPEQKITVILGPSGCGKTTLLDILAGVIPPDQGKRQVPNEISYLFQEPRLLPWLTVWKNLELILKDKVKPAEISDLVAFYLEATGILEYADYYPSELSGGMRQRVALARAFCFQAPLLLMDEPFKSLDLKVRYKLISDFIGLWRKQPRTVVAVTHDLKEAVLMGDSVVLLSGRPGRVQQRFEIECPQEEREYSREIISLETKLWELLLK